jgi:hypothetical protein
VLFNAAPSCSIIFFNRTVLNRNSGPSVDATYTVIFIDI